VWQSVTGQPRRIHGMNSFKGMETILNNLSQGMSRSKSIVVGPNINEGSHPHKRQDEFDNSILLLLFAFQVRGLDDISPGKTIQGMRIAQYGGHIRLIQMRIGRKVFVVCGMSIIPKDSPRQLELVWRRRCLITK
jgi:hypothetical protein